MKLAVSNIGWLQHDDPAVLAMMREQGVTGIEVAPTKIWPDWEGANIQTAEAYRRFLVDEGFEVPALQAILFGRPHLQVFQPETHGEFLDHLRLVADLATGLGASVLVFGSPKNRRRGQLTPTEARSRAADFFRLAGDICVAAGCCIAIEHNPVEYFADFGTNVAEVDEFVRFCKHDGVQLHLDSSGLHLCGGDSSGILRQFAPNGVHYHASEPMLAPISGGVVDHKEFVGQLRRSDYQRWISIEMGKPSDDEFNTLRASISVISTLLSS